MPFPILADSEVANVQHSRDGSEDALLTLRIESNEMQSLLCAIETLDVVVSLRSQACISWRNHVRCAAPAKVQAAGKLESIATALHHQKPSLTAKVGETYMSWSS